MTDNSSAGSQPIVTVLICDDYEPLRILLRSIIERCPGLSVVGEAADGHEAIVEAARLQPDVILLDLAMPRKSGLEALREITLVAPMSNVIVFSGFSTASVASDVTALGAVLYLEKGASPEEIIEAIERAAVHTTALPEPTGSAPPRQ